MDALTVIGTGIRTALLADTRIVAEVHDNVAQDIAPGSAPLPYVSFTYMYGGALNNTPKDAIDVQVLVTGVAKSQPKARELAGFVREDLHRQYLTYPDGWLDWATVTEGWLFRDVATIQNIQYWREGAYYRFRIIKE